jgi:hypothetical protein
MLLGVLDSIIDTISTLKTNELPTAVIGVRDYFGTGRICNVRKHHNMLFAKAEPTWNKTKVSLTGLRMIVEPLDVAILANGIAHGSCKVIDAYAKSAGTRCGWVWHLDAASVEAMTHEMRAIIVKASIGAVVSALAPRPTICHRLT